MFDIGFLELLLLSVIGLLVLGPERLPRVARTIGAYVGKARRTWTHVRMEIEREIAAEEIKRQVQEPVESLKRDLGGPVSELDELRRSTERAFREPDGRSDGQPGDRAADTDAAGAAPEGEAGPGDAAGAGDGGRADAPAERSK